MDLHDEHLRPVVDRLRAERPEASGYELDAIRQRVLARTAAHPPRHRVLASRAVAVVALVLGFTLSAAGAGLAVSGFAGNDQASVAQYPTTSPPGTPVAPQSVPPSVAPEQQVLPEEAIAPEQDDEAPAAKPNEAPSSDAQPDSVQADRQVASGLQSGDELPLTGFAALPVLVIGLALLGFGLVSRRHLHTR